MRRNKEMRKLDPSRSTDTNLYGNYIYATLRTESESLSKSYRADLSETIRLHDWMKVSATSLRRYPLTSFPKVIL